MVYLASYESGGSLYNRGREYILGGNLLNFGFMKEYGRIQEVEQEASSKPRLRSAEGVEFNISHIKGLVVCAVVGRTLDADMEQTRPSKASLMRRVCPGTKRSFVMVGRSEMKRREWFFRL